MRGPDMDPPDYPEPPECCEEEMECFEDGVCLCSECGLRVAPYPDYDPGPDVYKDVELPDDYFKGLAEGPEKCPHDKQWGDCDACDFLSDIAYDAARESRHR